MTRHGDNSAITPRFRYGCLVSAALLSLMGMHTALALTDADQSLRTRDYSCTELRRLVQEQRSVRVKMFIGSRLIHADADRCAYNRYPRRFAWRTRDVFLCTAGYTCVYLFDDDDD